MSIGMCLRRYTANYLTPREAGQIPLPEFLPMIERLYKADVTVTGVDRGWLAGRIAEAARIEGGCGSRAEGNGRSDGRRPDDICIFAKEQRTDGGCSFMDTHGCCHYVHRDTFRRIIKKGARRKEGVEARMIGKHPNKEAIEGTGERKQRNG